MDEKALLKTGLTQSEIKVYISLLELGDSTRSNIVEKSNIAGSKVYDVLKRLKNKGLVSIYLKNNIMHFKAMNPKQLDNYLDSKKEEIDDAKSDVNQIMPNLLNLFQNNSDDQEVELLSGLKGIHILFQEQVELLKKGDCCYVIGGTKDTEGTDVHAFFQKVHLWRESKGIKSKMLFNESQREISLMHYSKSKFPLTKTRFISHTSPVAINVYADITAIIIFGKTISAIKIKSNDVANSFLEYFDLLWKTSKN